MFRLTAVLALAASIPAQDFWLAHVPDTQWYTESASRMRHMEVQVGMLTVLPWRPSYIAHVGDLTEDAFPAQFVRGMRVMGYPPTTGIPTGISIGNHDYGSVGNKLSGTAAWRRYVGAVNRVNVFSTPQGDIAAIHLEWRPSDAALGMAAAWMDSNPTTPVVLVTHAWIMPPPGTPAGSRVPGANSPRETVGDQLDGAGDNSAETAYRKLVEPYPQIFLVLSGHNWTMARRVDLTPLGAEVHQTCVDFQGDPNGGNGFLRAVAFQRQRMNLYDGSWSYTGNGPDRTHFESVPIIRTPAQVRAWLASTRVWRGEPVADTFVFPAWGGGSTRANFDPIWTAATGAQEHGLIRFDVASAPPARAAILRLTTEGHSTEGDGFALHRMLRPWKDTDSWNSLGGLTRPGVDYVAAPDVSVPANGHETMTLDVTGAVRAWQGGQPNYGWCVVGAGESSGFRSSEWFAPTERPLLVVTE